MHFSVLPAVLLLSLTGLSVADLHDRAICINWVNNVAVYNEAATRYACWRYRNRNTGNKQWDKCPDCYYAAGGWAHCQSDGWHMGGDEITYYCKLKGAVAFT
ncbi:hypothetical protein NHQ30_009740 [Ciborinia camelliae]|nr:hypothetical protein NHQ30_009740 [Ciborinia camelliae]